MNFKPYDVDPTAKQNYRQINTSAINLTTEKLLNLTTFIKGQQLNVSLTLSYTKTKKNIKKNLTEN
jgi:hypothetical protein